MRNRKRFSGVLFIIMMFFCLPLGAQTDGDILHAANQAMRDGNYQDAAAAYQQLIDSGIENAALQDNLALALYRQNQIGGALFHLIAANRLKPRDADIQANLNFVRSQTTDKIEPVPFNPLVRVTQKLSRSLSLKEAWIGLVVIVVAFFVLASLYLYVKRRWLFWSLLVLGCGVLLLAGIVIKKEFLSEPYGVIVAQKAEIYSGPDQNDILLFELHEGAEFTILRSNMAGWLEIGLADGKKGWIEAKQIIQ